MRAVIEKETQLLDALAALAPTSSKTTLRSWLKEGRVTVDGQPAKRADILLAKGQVVAVGVKTHFVAEKIRVVYEDEHLIAIEKPSGLLSVATAFEKGETVHALLKKHFHPRKVFVVHRLGRTLRA